MYFFKECLQVPGSEICRVDFLIGLGPVVKFISVLLKILPVKTGKNTFQNIFRGKSGFNNLFFKIVDDLQPGIFLKFENKFGTVNK